MIKTSPQSGTPGAGLNRVEHHVLCVDDDPNFLDSMRFVLSDRINEVAGPIWYRISFLDNPNQALEMLTELRAAGETVAMIISDQKMPQMKGTELLRQARELFPDTARVLLTGYAGLESAIDAINERLLDKYLTKPIDDANDFMVSVRHLLQNFHMRRTIDRQTAVLRDLYAFSDTLGSIEDPERTLAEIVAFTCRVLDCERVSLMLLERGALRIKAAHGLPDDVVASACIRSGGWVSAEVFKQRRAVFARSLDDVPYVGPAVRTDAQSFISVPLLFATLSSGETALGVLNVTEKHGDGTFTEADLETLSYIANTASIAIHNQQNRRGLRDAYSEATAKAAALEHRMTHDPLTELPNRTLLCDRIRRAIEIRRQGHTPFLVLVLDLDRFREINESLGHHNGDIVLQQAAERLHGALEAGEVIARLGGDVFAVLAPFSAATNAATVVARLREALAQPVSIQEQPVDLTASVGVAAFPEHGEGASVVLQRAEIAMYEAKRKGGGWAMYAPELDAYNPRRLKLGGDLKRAAERGQLRLYYQPKLDIAAGRVCGVEALIRWAHPDFGLVPPDQFLPVAEQIGCMGAITRWVLAEALRQCAAWLAQGRAMEVAVNLSARDLREPDLPAYVAEQARLLGLTPDVLDLEITETTVMENMEHARKVLKDLRAMGARVAVDDFGTGHSSLAYLRNLPVDQIKIDKSFIDAMESSPDDTPIVRSMVELGHNLGLRVVAEGVESQDVLDRLAALGCDAVQGFLISRPLPPDELDAWLRARQGGWKVKTPPV
jgi:diguanylate cyclase (GGDEF)-like protein